MRIIIAVESGSDMPKWLAEQYGIWVVPMHVTFGSTIKDDGAFPVEEICQYYDQTGKLPKTSGCVPEDFVRAFDDIHAAYPDAGILHLAYSAVTTCSFQSAKIAAQGRDYVLSVDTQHVTIGQSAVVARVAKALAENPSWTLEQAGQYAQQVAAQVRMCFMPSNLDYLRAGGRVSNAVAISGNILRIHPLIELLDGHLKSTKKYRGKMDALVLRMMQDYTEANNLDREEIWLLGTTGLEDTIRESAMTYARETLGFRTVHWEAAGGVITTHGGPKAFAMAGYAKP